MYRVRGPGAPGLLQELNTTGWERVRRLGAEPGSPGRQQVLLAEKLYLRNNATMGLVLAAEGVVSDEVLVTVTTVGGQAGVLRTRLWANQELEREALQRLNALAQSKGWQVEPVETYHHHS